MPSLASHQAPASPATHSAPVLTITHENVASAALAIWHQHAHLKPDDRPLAVIAAVIDGMATVLSVRNTRERAAGYATAFGAASRPTHFDYASNMPGVIPVPVNTPPPVPGTYTSPGPLFDVVEITMLAAAGIVVPNSDLHRNLHYGNVLPHVLAVLHEQYPDVDQSTILGDLPAAPPLPSIPLPADFAVGNGEGFTITPEGFTITPNQKFRLTSPMPSLTMARLKRAIDDIAACKF